MHTGEQDGVKWRWDRCTGPKYGDGSGLEQDRMEEKDYGMGFDKTRDPKAFLHLDLLPLMVTKKSTNVTA